MSKPTITEFLEARIAQDEELASAALVGMHGKHEDAWDWGSYVLGAERDSTPKQDEFITEWWPARVLAECAAKRVILELHMPVRDEGWKSGASNDYLWCGCCGSVDDSPEPYPCGTLQALASVYKDHPDYDPSWAPDA